MRKQIKSGDILICISPIPGKLAEGKEYVALQDEHVNGWDLSKQVYIRVQDDTGGIVSRYAERFIHKAKKRRNLPDWF